MSNKYYVYEWFNSKTNEVFYVGKGTGNRYKNYWDRNQFFKDYYNNNPTEVRIVRYFDDEQDAFDYEKSLTNQYRALNQCQCNLIDGGFGGYSNVWNDNAKLYKSIYNPMKEESQRKRMSENNPMFALDKRKSMGEKHRTKIQIGNEFFDGIIVAANKYHVTASAINNWLVNGINPYGDICHYIVRSDYKNKVKTNNKEIIVDNKEYFSIAHAAHELSLDKSHLSKALREGKSEYKGHSIRYKNTPDTKVAQ